MSAMWSAIWTTRLTQLTSQNHPDAIVIVTMQKPTAGQCPWILFQTSATSIKSSAQFSRHPHYCDAGSSTQECAACATSFSLIAASLFAFMFSLVTTAVMSSHVRPPWMAAHLSLDTCNKRATPCSTSSGYSATISTASCGTQCISVYTATNPAAIPAVSRNTSWGQKPILVAETHPGGRNTSWGQKHILVAKTHPGGRSTSWWQRLGKGLTLALPHWERL